MKRWCFAYGLKIFIGVLFCGVLLGVAVMFLWNWLVPQIFNGPTINFIQAIGLLILVRALVGFGGWKGRCGCNQPQSHGAHGYFRKRWQEKLSSLTPEERDKVKEKYKKCWGYGDVCDDDNPEEKK